MDVRHHLVRLNPGNTLPGTGGFPQAFPMVDMNYCARLGGGGAEQAAALKHQLHLNTRTLRYLTAKKRARWPSPGLYRLPYSSFAPPGSPGCWF